MTKQTIPADEYASSLATQLRKGFLAYCVLKVCSKDPVYTSDIIKRLRKTELVVVEGTIYPLLSRLQKDGLLEHTWKESEMGPPRKYHKITEYGEDIMKQVAKSIETLNATLESI